VIVRAIKNMVLTGREVLSMDLVIESLRREDQQRELGVAQGQLA